MTSRRQSKQDLRAKGTPHAAGSRRPVMDGAVVDSEEADPGRVSRRRPRQPATWVSGGGSLLVPVLLTGAMLALLLWGGARNSAPPSASDRDSATATLVLRRG
jgi:hypothetical protein